MEMLAKKGESPLLATKFIVMSKALNVHQCLKIVEPFAKFKYILAIDSELVL